jgi:hypothetical protein
MFRLRRDSESPVGCSSEIALAASNIREYNGAAAQIAMRSNVHGVSAHVPGVIERVC